MRNLSNESEEMASRGRSRSQAEWARRTVADYSSVLLELARAERGFRFYGETDPRRRSLADRAHRALESELARAGALEFRLADREGAGFTFPTEERHLESTGPLADFETSLRRHGIESLKFDPTITRTALAGFFALLGNGQAHAREADPDALARTLAARDSAGLCINGLAVSETEIKKKALSSTPPRASVSLSRTSITPPTAIQPHTSDKTPSEKRKLHEAPLHAPASDDRGDRIRARLVELDATTEDAAYLERVRDIVFWAEELWNAELEDECYRVMLVLADHAVGSGGRSAAQARAATGSFRGLACGDRLNDLIDRATDEGMAGVRAAQLLLQLGEDAVSSILERLAREENPDRGAPLRALLLTQGERALPALIQAIEGQDDARARLGIQLAGEMQNPEALPALLRSLQAPECGRRVDAIRALSLHPGREASGALQIALKSELDEIAGEAGRAIARLQQGEALPSLLNLLEDSTQSGRTQLSCMLVEALGSIGDERAVPRLCAILERRPVLRRAHWHALQLSTVKALAVLPTKEARRCIDRAARDGTQSVRSRAREVVERLAQQDPLAGIQPSASDPSDPSDPSEKDSSPGA